FSTGSQIRSTKRGCASVLDTAASRVYPLQMNRVGKLIEDQRKRRGLSRRELAQLLDVSAQTILNVERDPHYNLGTRLLRGIEVGLGGEFHISFEEGMAMNRIRMGNDEFILNIRKNGECPLTNDQLGRRVWVWLRDYANGKQL